MESKSDRATRRPSAGLGGQGRPLRSQPNSRRHRAMSIMQKCPWQEEPGSAPEKKGAQIEHKAAEGQLQGYGR